MQHIDILTISHSIGKLITKTFVVVTILGLTAGTVESQIALVGAEIKSFRFVPVRHIKYFKKEIQYYMI